MYWFLAFNRAAPVPRTGSRKCIASPVHPDWLAHWKVCYGNKKRAIWGGDRGKLFSLIRNLKYSYGEMGNFPVRGKARLSARTLRSKFPRHVELSHALRSALCTPWSGADKRRRHEEPWWLYVDYLPPHVTPARSVQKALHCACHSGADVKISNMYYQQFKTIFSKVFRIPEHEITEDLSYQSISQWDSFNHINLILSLEDAFNLQIKQEEIPKLSSFTKSRHTKWRQYTKNL